MTRAQWFVIVACVAFLVCFFAAGSLDPGEPTQPELGPFPTGSGDEVLVTP